MLNHIIEWVIQRRWLVLALGGVLAVVGFDLPLTTSL